MLTGDLEKVAKKVGEDLELDETYSNLLPQDKVSKFEEIIKNKNIKRLCNFRWWWYKWCTCSC